MQSKVDRATNCFKDGFACSQAVLSTFSEDFGLSQEMALKAGAAFGGGIAQRGEICGAVSGALMVIGLKYGKIKGDDSEAKQKTYNFVHEFINRFIEQNNSILCKELLGYDMSNESEKQIIQEKELTKTLCPKYVQDAVIILERLL